MIFYATIRDPFDYVIFKCVVPDCLCDFQLDHIAANILLVAGFLGPPLLADIVEVQLPCPACAGDAGHGTFAMPAEQLAGEKIVTIDAVTPLWIFLRGNRLLDLEVELIADDPRDAALNANIAVDINAAVSLVGKDLLKARPPPRTTIRGCNASIIQTGHDINECLAAGNAREDLPDNRSLRLVDGIVQRFVRFIAVRQMAVRHHAVCGVVVQTALDVLGHVLGIKLIDIHHRAGGEAPGRSVVEILLHIENADAQLLKPCFVDKCLQHIAAYTV